MDKSEGFHPAKPLTFDFAPGGWMRINFPVLDAHLLHVPTVLIKTVERDGRRVITRLVVAADQVDSTVMKALPTGRLEGLANVPWIRERLERTDKEADQLGKALERLLSGPPSGILEEAQVSGSQRAALGRPDGSDPDGFYRNVAAAYNEALTRTSAPAPVLAAEAGVPVPTARRWIAEARRRGLLPRARKGRAG
jgi:hypothetical protein